MTSLPSTSPRLTPGWQPSKTPFKMAVGFLPAAIFIPIPFSKQPHKKKKTLYFFECSMRISSLK